MTYVGIDLHSNNMVIVAINSNGEVIQEFKLPTSRRSLEDFFGSFDGPVKAVVECTSNWYWLADWCRANGVDLRLAHAKMAGAISYAKVKTDKVDARTLAELLRADLIPEAYQITRDRRELRELTRGRLRLVQWRGKLQSALWGQAIKYNVQISGSQWRQLNQLQQWLAPQLPPAASLQAELLIEQMSQIQQHIHRVEEEIEKQIPFEASAEQLLREIWDEDKIQLVEEFYVLLLNNSKRCIGCSKISSGGSTATIVDPAKVMQVALLGNAESIILAHNHPSGNLQASQGDKTLTSRIKTSGKLLGIPVEDHIILTVEGYLSFRQEGLF